MSLRGWRLRGTVEPTYFRPHKQQIVSLTHTTGLYFTGTQWDLMKRYPEYNSGNISTLFSGKAKSAYGWKLTNHND
jgi:hypothetical protein